MPKVKVRTDAERYVPASLLQYQAVIGKETGAETVTTRRVLNFRSLDLTPAERIERAERATRLSQHIRDELQLGRRVRLSSCVPLIYQELDHTGQQITEHGAMIIVASTDDGNAHRLFKDHEFAPSHLDEADLAFAGGLALQSHTLGADITVHFGEGVNHVGYDTPRTQARSGYLASVTELHPTGSTQGIYLDMAVNAAVGAELRQVG